MKLIDDITEELPERICLMIERDSSFGITQELPLMLCFNHYIKLAKVERELALKYGMFYPTKYPFGFNRFARWYIRRGLNNAQ